jgi:hypothetical protein
MMDRELTLVVPTGATTSTVSVSGTSAQSVALSGGSSAVVYTPVDCFVTQGVNPTATTACMPLLAGQQYRLGGLQPNNKLAFITSGGTGTVYITPGA